MKNIVITHGKDNGDLEWKVNGHPNNGDIEAGTTQDIHWKVDNSSNVERIHNIVMKNKQGAPPSTNIFRKNPPRRQDSHSKHWKAKVDSNAPIGAVYDYDVEWVPKGSTDIKTYDPKIAVNSRLVDPSKIILYIVFAVACLFSLQFLRRKLKNR